MTENGIGLLRVQGKGQKERALFVVDQLYRNLVSYLAHPESPKQKAQPMFPIHTDKHKAKNSYYISNSVLPVFFNCKGVVSSKGIQI